MKGIKLEYKNSRSNTLTIHSPKIVKANGFLQARGQDSQKLLCFALSFLKGFLKVKKLEMKELDININFLISYLFRLPFIKKLTSSSNFLKFFK
jgi:hypothetical protein